MHRANICIAGIGTDVGKTAVSAALCSSFEYGYFKLVQAGDEHDNSKIKTLVDFAKAKPKIYPNGINLSLPASPHLGSKSNEYDALSIDPPASSNVLIELAGGLYTPLGGKGGYMIDYPAFYHISTFLVAREYLGCINHTMLSLSALRTMRINVLGVIVSGKNSYLGDFLIKCKEKVFIFDEFKNGNEFVISASHLARQIEAVLPFCEA